MLRFTCMCLKRLTKVPFNKPFILIFLGDHECIKCCYSNIHQGININMDAEAWGTSSAMGWDRFAVWVLSRSNDNIYLCECS